MRFKRVAFTLVALITVLTGCSSTSTSNSFSDKIQYSLDQYDFIEPGMNYNEITDILGSPTENTAKAEVGGITSEAKSWKNKDGSNIVLTFTDDKLVAKAQAGLKQNKDGFVRLGDIIFNKKNEVEFKSFPVLNKQDDISIRIDNVTQNSSFLKLEFSCENNSDKQVTIGYFSTRLSVNGKYEYYDIKFDAVNRLNSQISKDIPMYADAKSNAKLVLFFKPVDTDKIDVKIQTIGDGINLYEFKNVRVEKQ
ncbi:MAG: DUF3862 domain-containing protein [Bacillota bacterium]|nr:DUF3862 domain-containing protein [Bacillota bacterium]